MRLNPVALALAFGVAKVAVTIFSILGGAVTMWTIRMPGGPPFNGHVRHAGLQIRRLWGDFWLPRRGNRRRARGRGLQQGHRPKRVALTGQVRA